MILHRKAALRTLGLLLVAQSLAAPFFAAPAASQQDPAVPATAAVLRPGDVVRVVVHRKDELSGEFVIAGDSTLAHPLYRGVKAAGLTLPELDARIRTHLLTYETNPQFIVEPLFSVAVSGDVRQPDLLTLRPEATLLQAIARAGGVTDRGRLDRVQLVRDGVVRVLDLSRPDLGYGQMTVRSGDQIYIPRRANVFRDYIAPSASLVAAAAALARVFFR